MENENFVKQQLCKLKFHEYSPSDTLINQEQILEEILGVLYYT